SLGALNGQWVKLRWHEGDDSTVSATGWYVDSVVIANAGTAVACTTAAGCTEGAACDDGNACTQADTCQGGVCAGAPVAAPSEVDNGVRVDRSALAAAISWNLAAGAATSDLLRGAL